jgi:hypothetical protein
VLKKHTIDTSSINSDIFGGLEKSYASDFERRAECYENVMKIFITFFITFHNILYFFITSRNIS